MVIERTQNSAKKGFIKRWFEEFEEEIEEIGWSADNLLHLFNLYKKKGNQWKEISLNFSNTTKDEIKDHFLLLIRNSLKNACKSVGLIDRIEQIDLLKSNVLLDFYGNIYEIQIEDKTHPIRVSQFVEFYSISEDQVSYSQSHQKRAIIAFFISHIKSIRYFNQRIIWRNHRTQKHTT